jgi:hypothetical protein
MAARRPHPAMRNDRPKEGKGVKKKPRICGAAFWCEAGDASDVEQQLGA